MTRHVLLSTFLIMLMNTPYTMTLFIIRIIICHVLTLHPIFVTGYQMHCFIIHAHVHFVTLNSMGLFCMMVSPSTYLTLVL
ncbi:hypothetical protein EDC04DRAFT_2718352, partial [Pisolithus marmoratus]